MDQASERRKDAGNTRPASDGETRLQQGGEAATTRFGMEDGDNTDVAGPTPPEGEDQA